MTEINNKTWVVIPCFNESPDVLKKVLLSLLAYEDLMLCVVDDGSRVHIKDDLGKICPQILDSPRIFFLRHYVNLGQGAALQTGFTFLERKEVDYVVTFDADGQHTPSDIPKAIKEIEKNSVDVVLGSRFKGNAINISPTKKMFLRFVTVFTRIHTGLKLSDSHNGFRAFTARAISKLDLRQNEMAHASEILQQIARNNLSYIEMPNTITYTNYSKAKGQRISNSINILLNLLQERIFRD